MIYEKVQVLGSALANESEPHPALRARSHGTCLRYKPAVEAIHLARSGNAAGLRNLLACAPDALASTPHGAKLLQLAVLAGRMPIVELLLDQVQGKHAVAYSEAPRRNFETLIFFIPLSVARVKRRNEIEMVLLHPAGRRTSSRHAFLGYLGALQEDLAHDPLFAQASEPAVDPLKITPIHHGGAGGHIEALRVLLRAY